MYLAEELGYSFKDEKCYSPSPIIDKSTGEEILVPCGHCLPCLRRRQSEWIVRLKEERRSSAPGSCYFVTLTYDDDFLPVVPGSDIGDLDRRDPIRFLRRMKSLVSKGGFTFRDPGLVEEIRIDLSRERFKYYLTAEYGPHGTTRPHFHIAFFNLDTDPARVDLLVRHCWPYGFVYVSQARDDDQGFIGYVTKYLVNNLLSPHDNVTKPFSLMSKGLGLSYVDRNFDYHRSDPIGRCYSIDHGKKNVMPRYWRERLLTYTERQRRADIIRDHLDRESEILDAKLDSPAKTAKFNQERKSFQKAQMYANLQLMLKKHKIK